MTQSLNIFVQEKIGSKIFRKKINLIPKKLFVQNCKNIFRSEQDLSLKCLAWKGFIPGFKYQSPSLKQILGPKNIWVR